MNVSSLIVFLVVPFLFFAIAPGGTVVTEEPVPLPTEVPLTLQTEEPPCAEDWIMALNGAWYETLSGDMLMISLDEITWRGETCGYSLVTGEDEEGEYCVLYPEGSDQFVSVRADEGLILTMELTGGDPLFFTAVDPYAPYVPGPGDDPTVCYKPVIYLYPETETEVIVSVEPDGGMTCAWPEYAGGWRVTAEPDGTLRDAEGHVYRSLFWEGLTETGYSFDDGFCVPGSETGAFLLKTLPLLGLDEPEMNEFISYWLPRMQGNAWNVIRFCGTEYTDHAPLAAEPAPDTVIRVFMAYYAAAEEVPIPAQELSAPERTGFTLVEWGGTEILP